MRSTSFSPPSATPPPTRLARSSTHFPAGPVATLTVRLNDGQFVEVEVSRRQLNEFTLSAGDEVALRVHHSNGDR